MTSREYQVWLSGRKDNEPPAVRGQKIFEQLRCASCHLGPGSQQRGPALAGVFGRPVKLKDGSTVVANDGYLRESIVQPQARIVGGFQPIMPSFAVNFENDEEGLLDLIAYIKAMDENGAIGAGQQTPPQEADKQ
jgi:cytochrome c oxidase subunit 2